MRKMPGVHTPHRKNTAGMKAVALPVPPVVRISMAMHIGAPAKPLVSVGDYVYVGQIIADAGGFVSSPVHSSVSGTVKSIDHKDPATGERGTFIVIETDGEQAKYDGIAVPKVENAEEFINAMAQSGIVGLGGAGFPTSVKLKVDDVSRIEYIIINGAECEPYITSDTRTMIDDAKNLWNGIRLLKKYLGDPQILIGIEDNKPEAIKVMKQYAAEEPIAKVCPLPSMYPQGGEKVLIYNLTGRIVPEGKLPIDVGAIVINCTTLASISRYVINGLPLVKKTVTVDGTGIKNPMNVIVPIGTPISYIIDFCGGMTEGTKKIMLGGPMMGAAVPSTDVVVKKNTNAVLVFDEKDLYTPKDDPCIRCGRCAASCPLGLMAAEIHRYYLADRPDLMAKYNPGVCMECGCCAYVCPAGRPLAQYMKLSKAALREYEAKQKQKAGA